MIELRAIPTSILNQFKALPVVAVCEVCRIFWDGGSSIKHYSNAAWHQAPGFENITYWSVPEVDPRFERDSWFLDVPRTSDISDDVVRLKFWDGDLAISTLYESSGEGTRVEVAQYFPQIDDPSAPGKGWYNPIFWGLMKAPKDGDGTFFSIEVSTGLRSPNLPIPRRAIYPGCQAIFGGERNPFTGGYWFDAQWKIDENDCPYNRHIGGSVGNLNPLSVPPNQPYDFCPRRDKNDCKIRIGDPVSTGKALPYLGFEVVIEGEFVGIPWRGFVAYTQANETALKEPIRVVYGQRIVRDLVLLAFQQQSGGSNPQNGYLKCLFVNCEGPIVGLGDGSWDGNAWSNPDDPLDHPRGPSTKRPGSSTYVVNDTQVACFDVDYSGSFGVLEQPPTDFTTPANRPQALGYSMTSVARVNVGRGDWRNITADQVRGQVEVKGLKNIRRYTAPTTYTRGYTTNRAWCLLDLLTSRRYGLGYDFARFEIADWIDLAAYCDELVPSINEGGTAVSVTRSTFNAVISSRKAGEIISDVCMSGRMSPPFNHGGRVRIVALDLPPPATASSVPNFTDEDDGINPYVANATSGRNIIWNGSRSTLGYSRKSDSEIPNQIKLTYDDAAYKDAERPIVVKDDDRQLAAGKAYGDFSLRAVEKSYVGFGVSRFPEAARLAQLMLYYGEFDKGGTKNNMVIKFRTWSLVADAVGLHPFAIIRVVSRKINRFVEGVYGATTYQCEYFRIQKMKRVGNLECEIEAQLYPRGFILSTTESVPAAGETNPGGNVTDPVKVQQIVDVTTAPGGGTFRIA